MSFTVNEDMLEEALLKVERDRNWNPSVISKLENYIRTANDKDLFRASALQWAVEKSVDEYEAVKSASVTLQTLPDPTYSSPRRPAKRFFARQTFHDLFRSEVLQQEEGFGIKDVTIMFTDLNSFIQLYQQIGDLIFLHAIRCGTAKMVTCN